MVRLFQTYYKISDKLRYGGLEPHIDGKESGPVTYELFISINCNGYVIHIVI